MVASRGRAGDSPTAIRVSTVTYGSDGDERAMVESYSVDPSEPPGQQFRSVAVRVARHIQEAWKSGNLLSFERSGEIDVAVPVSGLDAWISISRALSDTPSTDEVRVLSVNRDVIRVRLRYFGDTEGFKAALRRNDLHLRREDEGWSLTRDQRARAAESRVVPESGS